MSGQAIIVTGPEPRERKRHPKRERPELEGRDIADLDPQLRSVKPKDLRHARELRAGDDEFEGDLVKRVPGYPYGVGEVVDISRLHLGRTRITIDFPSDLHGRVEVEMGGEDRLEIHDPDFVEVP